MNRKLKEIIKNHIATVKEMYPELYIEVRMHGNEILISVSSLEISDEAEYEALICDFYEEYDRKILGNIFWGVDLSLTKDDLHLLEDPIKVPKKENLKENKPKKMPLAQAHG